MGLNITIVMTWGASSCLVLVRNDQKINLKFFFRKFLSLKVAPPQSEGEQELMLPDVCSESWLTSQTKDGQLSEFISGHLSLSPCWVGCLKELLTSTLLLFIKLNAHTGLGPGQLVGRQVLGSPVLGDIQLSLCDKRGNLEVEVRPIRESQKLENSVKVIRARGLQSKPGSKLLPGYFFAIPLVLSLSNPLPPQLLG